MKTHEDFLRIDYDHQALDIMYNVNRILASKNLVFQDDGEDHDGFMVYILRELNHEISPR